MAFLKTANRAISTLAAGVNDVVGTWTLAGGEGALFPAAGDFHVTCEDEIAKCTGRAGDVLTVTRGQEGTAGAAHTSGKTVELRITSEVIDQLKTIIQDAAGVTKVDVEESAAEKIIRMDVNSVEAFHLSAVGILTLAQNSRCAAYLDANQLNIVNNTWTKVNVNAERYDPRSEFNTATYKFTAIEAGTYGFFAVTWIFNIPAADKEFYCGIYLNGALVPNRKMLNPTTAGITTLLAGTIVLAANDELELYGAHVVGDDTPDFYGDANDSTFIQIFRIG